MIEWSTTIAEIVASRRNRSWWEAVFPRRGVRSFLFRSSPRELRRDPVKL